MFPISWSCLCSFCSCLCLSFYWLFKVAECAQKPFAYGIIFGFVAFHCSTIHDSCAWFLCSLVPLRVFLYCHYCRRRRYDFGLACHVVFCRSSSEDDLRRHGDNSWGYCLILFVARWSGLCTWSCWQARCLWTWNYINYALRWLQ